MNGDLALQATLACTGGRFLRDAKGGELPDLRLGNSSFQFVESFVADVRGRGFLRRTITARNPEAWLKALKSAGYSDLNLVTNLGDSGDLPPHVAVAFANSGTWALRASRATNSTIWTLRWEVGDRDAVDRRIWRIVAAGVDIPSFTSSDMTVDVAASALRRALEEARAFASSHDETRAWSDWFTKAVAALDSPNPLAPYHQDTLPPDAALERRQLIAAAIQGWVFGGMGSWNDGGFTDPKLHDEYERVGARLYAALLDAVATAANGA